ncbi:MAG: hypothetical protein ACRDN9_02185 [Streptosporangiaceae bacterium]
MPTDDAAPESFQSRMHGWVADIRAERYEPQAAACPTCDFRRFCRHART